MDTPGGAETGVKTYSQPATSRKASKQTAKNLTVRRRRCGLAAGCGRGPKVGYGRACGFGRAWRNQASSGSPRRLCSP